MKMRNFYLAFAFTGISITPLTLSAQKTIANLPVQEEPVHQVPAHRSCGTVERSQAAMDANPELRASREAFLAECAAIAAEGGFQKVNGVINIPVVVHVVYRTSAGNISDAQINSQIDVLNKDYRALNTDIGSVPSVWTSLVGDVGFEFCLASKDPSGAPTTGITRTSTTISNIGSTSSYYTVAPIWNRTKYMNFWVCEIGGGTLGYTYLPGSAAAAWDGIVIDYHYFGTMGTVSAPFNKGRTATHEVGHWFNLEHIWGDDGGSCSGSDFVADTPNQADENYGCPGFPLTDACTSVSPGVMHMNYMDYTNDACMYFFTQGQSARMNTAIAASPRTGLLTSDGCSGSSGSACRDTLNYPMTGTATVYVPSGAGAWGYVGGHNNYGDLAKANYYSSPGLYTDIEGVRLEFALASASAPASDFVTVSVWNASGGLPGSKIGSETLTYADIIANSGDVYVPFSPTIAIPGPYFVGVEFTYGAGDTMSLYTNADGETSPGIAYELFSDGTTWAPFTDATNSWGIDVMLGIYPDVSYCATDVEEGTTVQNISVYPNPSNGSFTLEFGRTHRSDLSIDLYNQLGQVVASEKLNQFAGNYSQTWKAPGAGIYYLVVRDAKGQHTEKIVVQ